MLTDLIRAKRDRDDEDFRSRARDAVAPPDCIFCLPFSELLEETRLAIAVRDGFPVTDGHTLILPRRDVADFSSITHDENEDVFALTRVVRARLPRDDPCIEGFNFGTNEGEAAGQTVNHCHFHLIPRRRGDTPNPTGEIRRVVNGREPYGGRKAS